MMKPPAFDGRGFHVFCHTTQIALSSYVHCLLPHSGQNLVPAGIALPQLVQNTDAFCFAPHSGQNFAPAEIEAPHALQTAPAGAAGAAGACGAVAFMLCANI